MIWFGWILWHINHCRLFNVILFNKYLTTIIKARVQLFAQLNGFKYSN